MRMIREPARDIPVLIDADIVVVGGGTTGPIAAVAAARRGKKVVLIERFGSLAGRPACASAASISAPATRAARPAGAGASP